MTYSMMADTEDPYLFDSEDLQTIADERTIRQGLADFKDYRVIAIDQNREMLWGQVEDDNSDVPVDVQLRLASDEKLSFCCDCSAGADGVCRHQVALLYAYAHQQGESDELMGATDTAIKDRMKRGRSEVRVEPMSGEPWFGTWRAASMSSTTHFPQNYRVTIRSLHRRTNFCSCPDFANNQLGTCKHIEAVLHKIKKHQDFDKFRDQPVPFSYVYLAWDVEDAHQIRLHRSRLFTSDLRALFDDYFDSSGLFKGRLPDGFFRFVEIADERGDVHIGEDALDFARYLAAAAAHRLRSAEIRSQITNSSGRLAGIKASLYPYQVEGTAFLAGTGRALLADDMGLDKTYRPFPRRSGLRNTKAPDIYHHLPGFSQTAMGPGD